jgi:hypothetical protein
MLIIVPHCCVHFHIFLFPFHSFCWHILLQFAIAFVSQVSIRVDHFFTLNPAIFYNLKKTLDFGHRKFLKC